MVTFANISGIPGCFVYFQIFIHSDSETGIQKYKSCKWAGARNQMEEHEACDVVVQGLWEMHLLDEKNSKDAVSRQSGCVCGCFGGLPVKKHMQCFKITSVCKRETYDFTIKGC